MKVIFTLRKPGNHEIIDERHMDGVPRPSDLVSLDGENVHLVHSVTWNLKLGIVDVLLRV